MKLRTPVAATAATLVAAALTGTTVATTAGSADAGVLTAGATKGETSYVVLAERGTSATDLARKLRAEGATVTGTNEAIGMVTVTTRDAGFRAGAARVAGVDGIAANREIGRSPVRDVSAIERENLHAKVRGHVAAKKGGAGDPLDTQLWGMRMIKADQAHRATLGSKRVKVGVIDTGVQADHPDLHPNFDYKLSRNFATDMPDIDGPCEVASCHDPATVDEGGHGSHVAGTIAAAMNGLGVSGVAPGVDLVNVRAGQDSGYFFLAPTVNALTYAGDAGLDVVNMSFYVDPWLYNCKGGAPEDTAEQAADQDTIIEAMNRALDYAHDKGVTMVAATGNNHEDLANPRVDGSSPDYGADPHSRTIDNSNCFDMPVEGPHVIGVNSVGPSGKKSDLSNYTTDLTSGEVEVAAPGGWYRDGFGTDTYSTNENLILSSVPLVSVQETGEVDADGNITDVGRDSGVQKVCSTRPARGAAKCGYYAFYQGTSMATPHTTGVAALAVSAHGRHGKHGAFGMAPDAVRSLLMRTATDHACPDGGVQSYTDEGRSAEFTATCVGTKDFNGFYGAGIVNALGVVR